MLKDMVMSFGSIFLFLCFVVAGGMFIGMVTQWNAVQNEAQYIARSMGKYGGYTTEADEDLRKFTKELNIAPDDIDVEIEPVSAPVDWGTTVTAKITRKFHFKVGEFIDIKTPIPLVGKGRSVSTYLDGAYSGISYCYPSY
ncbi:hypothetical protein JOC37_001328 [Desulfohalotomaculum tongense]|uniref:hypothetical protein n=1 Tax=Desulforadius tongensis TaxID=1216062 RepID=UPI0019580C7F|nr:hypothetical protein [Desulforadius tongensis]MBM7854948.1 hypothetical protein [Desulforadius tongensis]